MSTIFYGSNLEGLDRPVLVMQGAVEVPALRVRVLKLLSQGANEQGISWNLRELTTNPQLICDEHPIFCRISTIQGDVDR